jgi:integrase
MMTLCGDDRLGVADLRLDACGSASTRTLSTVMQYRKAAAQIIKQSRPDDDGDDVSRLAHAIAWFSERAGSWTKATIRHHRAALRQSIFDLEAALGLSSVIVDELLELLTVSPEPKSNNARRLASARKRTNLRQEECSRLVASLAAKPTNTARLLAGLLAFGAVLGLRPVEWRDAILRGNMLFVRCAKATNGRGIAEVRSLVLDGFGQQEIADLGHFIGAFQLAARLAGCWQVFHERLAKALCRACQKIGIEKIALYTLRHVALATAKRTLTAREVAAVAGHASERTAQQCYAKKRAGWRLRAPFARPTREMVTLVRLAGRRASWESRPRALRLN